MIVALFALAVGTASSASPDDFRVRFDVETTAGAQSFTLKINSEWAPIGAARFRELVKVCASHTAAATSRMT